MKLNKVWLQNFRNHGDLFIDFDPNVTLILGPNGSGKTNILEAIYLLATGRSSRADRIEQMVGWGGEVAHVKAVVSTLSGSEEEKSLRNQENAPERKWNFSLSSRSSSEGRNNTATTQLQATLTRGTINNQKTPLKTLSANGIRRQMRKFAGNLRAVIFGPADMRLIEGSPSRRREFMDDILSQVYPEYYRSLLSYQKGVTRRNKVLQAIREGLSERHQLFFWDKLLIKEGQLITQHREELINFLNQQTPPQPLPSEVRGISPSSVEAGGGGVHNDNFTQSHDHTTTLLHFQISYHHSRISEPRLAQYAREEVAAGTTLVGPHRDDFIVKQSPPSSPLKEKGSHSPQKRGESGNVNNITMKQYNNEAIDLSTYGSRGQQRMAILWLKLGVLSFIEQRTGEQPVLLLDDIFSELDHQHRDIVNLAILNQQTIITAADQHLVENLSAKIINLGSNNS